MERNETIDSYLSMHYSNKYYYMVNNPEIAGEDVSLDELYHQVKQDLSIIFRVLKIAPNKNGFVYWHFTQLTNERDAALAFAKCYERCSSAGYTKRQNNATTAYKYFVG